MPLADHYNSCFTLIQKTLRYEDPPDQLSYFVYCTYNVQQSETYAHLIPDTVPDEPFLERSPAAPSIFDRFVVNRFRSYIEAYFKFYLPKPGSEKFHNGMNLEYIYMAGGASILEAREHIKTRLIPKDDEEAPYMKRYQMFIVIDDESLQSILEGPAPLTELEGPVELYCNGAMKLYKEKTDREKEMFVKLVDAEYDEACGGIITTSKGRGQLPKDSPHVTVFYGWFKVCPRSLFMMIGNLEIYDGIRGLFNTITDSGCLYNQI